MIKVAAKKLVSVMISFVLLFSVFSLDAFAEEQEIAVSVETRLASSVDPRTNHDAALAESINTQLKNFNELVDISEFNLTLNATNQQKIIDILSGGLPECFHIALSFSFIPRGGRIVAIRPGYIYTKSEYDSMLKECEAAADKMLAGIEDDPNLGDVEKLLVLHDRIAVDCEYDYENYLNGRLPQISHTLYGALVNKFAVCQGYALAYSYLLDRLGIENYYCDSNALYHAWNIVYINGKPYHIDITHDDPVWDITGRVSHTNFLVSTNELRKNNHNAYDYDSSPKDTTYDNYFWENINSAFVYLNGEIYYTELEGQQIINIKRYSDKKTIYSTQHYWMANSLQCYSGNYARLAVCGSKLLFSLSDGIYSLNPKTKEVEKIHSKPNIGGYYNIYGFAYKNGELVYDLSTTPTFNINIKKYYEYKVKYYKPGNINDDDTVDLQDVCFLAQVFANWQVECNSAALDVNGDGAENLKDLVHLAQYVAGWEGIELY